MTEIKPYPVVDLFAGPGGLGEGFSSLKKSADIHIPAFRTAISIEKDSYAHSTLLLRHFFRSFPPESVPEDYYRYLEGSISLRELYLFHPEAEARALQKSWLCTLGQEPHENVKKRISQSLRDATKWVLVGGPPCQAYSLVGRSRMRRNPEFGSDPRHYLYREYLRILADHRPPVFVMENVKGLLSSQLNGSFVIRQILKDLSGPGRAVFGTDSCSYRLFSLSEPGVRNTDADPASFTVRAEDYGIPQARHRVFIVGIRDDLDIQPATLEKTSRVTVRDVIGNMPPLRSSISKSADSEELWKQTLAQIRSQPWFNGDSANGVAELIQLAEEKLRHLEQVRLGISSSEYVAPDVLGDWFRDERLNVLSSHESRSHMQSDLQRYFFATLYACTHKVSPKLTSFPQELLPDHRNIERGGAEPIFADRFRVQMPDAPATTITSHISKDGHYFIHYDPLQCRSLTVREAARIQTFPDNYRFEGPRTAQYHQVGNAVPPLLAYKIAGIIHQVLEDMD